jgi:hypothetical protein
MKSALANTGCRTGWIKDASAEVTRINRAVVLELGLATTQPFRKYRSIHVDVRQGCTVGGEFLLDMGIQNGNDAP